MQQKISEPHIRRR